MLSSLWGKWRKAGEENNKLIFGDFRRAEALPRDMIHDPSSSCSELTWELPGRWGNLSGTRVLPTEQGTSSPNGTMTTANAPEAGTVTPARRVLSRDLPPSWKELEEAPQRALEWNLRGLLQGHGRRDLRLNGIGCTKAQKSPPASAAT